MQTNPPDAALAALCQAAAPSLSGDESKPNQPLARAESAQSAIESVAVRVLTTHHILAQATRCLRGMSHAAQLIDLLPDASERSLFWAGGLNALFGIARGDCLKMAEQDLAVENREGRSLWAWSSLTINAHKLPAAQVQEGLASAGIHIALQDIPNLHIKAAEQLKDIPVTIVPAMREHIAAISALSHYFRSLHQASMPEASQGGAA